jgi:hypothetical protein
MTQEMLRLTMDLSRANTLQGLTLVHFSAQPEPFLTLKTSPKSPKDPLYPRHQYPINSP